MSRPEPVLYPKLGALITERAMARSLPQKEIAQRLGVKAATVSRYFSGHRMPSGEHMPVLQEMLGLKPGEIAGAVRTAEGGDLRPIRGIDGEVREYDHEDIYPNRALFLLLHGDQLSAATVRYVKAHRRAEADMSVAEWRAFARRAEHERAEFGEELKDRSGFGEPPEKR